MSNLFGDTPVGEALIGMVSKVACVRCEKRLMDDANIAASSIIELTFPANDWRKVGSLCGRCSIDLLVFIFPGMEDGTDPVGTALVAEVREKFAENDIRAKSEPKGSTWHPGHP